MGREYRKDVEGSFSEQIDRLLNGEEVTDTIMDNDMRKSLDFARKLVAATPKPSPGFEAQLKAMLLRKLPEVEVAEESWFQRLIPRHPVWQAIAVLASVLIIVASLWGSGAFNPMEPAITSNILEVDAGTNKAIYASGETVKVEVTLKNVTSEPFVMEQFPPILSVMRTESRQPIFTFSAGRNSRTLMPNEIARFTVSWDQRDDAGRYVDGGGYYLELEDIDYGGQATKLTLTNPVTFDIQPTVYDIGEIYKTIDLDQSQTVGGITVTLQALELSDRGARLSALISPLPDYNQNRQSKDYAAFATYYIDRGWVKNAGLSSVEFSSSGMKHTWYLIGPIPQETSELLFIIMNTGRWEGPWQFRITLKQ